MQLLQGSQFQHTGWSLWSWGSGTDLGCSSQLWVEGIVTLPGVRSVWVRGASKRELLHKPTLLFICPHVIHSNHAGEKMKKNVSWKWSVQFGMVITEPETHVGSWTTYSAPGEDLPTLLFPAGNRPASQTPTISTSHGRIKLSYSCVRNLHQSAVKHWLPLLSSEQIIKSA